MCNVRDEHSENYHTIITLSAHCLAVQPATILFWFTLSALILSCWQLFSEEKL